MMSCHESNVLIEAIAVGDDVPDAVRAHVASCPQCAARLRLAQRIEQALSSRPVVAAPQGFAITVLARVRRERWRSEQLLDWSFNAFVGIGVALVVLGVVGLVYASGFVVVSRDVYSALDLVAKSAATVVVNEAPTVAMGMLLLTLTLGVWWWVEQEDAEGQLPMPAGNIFPFRPEAAELTAACTRRSNRARSSSGPAANASFSPSSVGFTRPRSNGTSSLSLAVAPSSST